MNILNNNYIYNCLTQYQVTSGKCKCNKDYSTALNYPVGCYLDSDVVSFCGKAKKSKKDKKIEDTLRDIDGLHDPYSDVLMISKHKFRSLKNKISQREDAESMNKLMDGYVDHMFDPEKEVFELLKKSTQKYSEKKVHCTYDEILQESLPAAKARLMLAQFSVVSEMRKYARKNMQNQDFVEATLCFDTIENNILNNEFRIKKSREIINELYDTVLDKTVVDELLKQSENFPNTATNSDAFIVKYAGRSHSEIAELLVSPAQISVEHIKPSSKNGESVGTNYLAASKRMNNYRKSTPLSQMIERYPNIPKQTQRYMDELINKINKGHLSDIALTLPGVKESLYEESNHLIDVDISAINPKNFVEFEKLRGKIGDLLGYLESGKSEDTQK